MLAIVDAYRAGLLNSRNWWPNIVSGLIVGIVALPLSMAFAIASGVKPEQGIYTAIIAGFFVGVLGGSRIQIAGPTGAFVVILAGVTAKYGIEGLQVATLLAGMMLVIMGFIRLGNVIKFIPDPVIVGFTTGIAFIIFVGEWKDFFGLTHKLPLDVYFHEKFIANMQALPHLDLATTGLALLSLGLVIFTPKVLKRVPGPLAALVIVTLLQEIFQFNSVETIGSLFGGIPRQLPHFKLPAMTMDQTLTLVGPAFTIALIGCN